MTAAGASPGALAARIGELIRGYGAPRAVVAFSGGVDSSVVLALAALALGPAAVEAVTAVSPSLPSGELEAARELARSLGVAHRAVDTHELDREAYARNDAMRCYHCKVELYATLKRIVREAGGPGRVVMAGANADDLADVRPGLRAAEQHGVANPLLEMGVGKGGVRALARHLGLPVAEKPALACLSSRVGPGIRVTAELLGLIDRAERLVKELGFGQVRVRHLGARASIEVPADQVQRLLDEPGFHEVAARVAALGWDQVDVDPEGYRQRSLNVVEVERAYSP